MLVGLGSGHMTSTLNQDLGTFLTIAVLSKIFVGGFFQGSFRSVAALFLVRTGVSNAIITWLCLENMLGTSGN